MRAKVSKKLQKPKAQLLPILDVISFKLFLFQNKYDVIICLVRLTQLIATADHNTV